MVVALRWYTVAWQMVTECGGASWAQTDVGQVVVPSRSPGHWLSMPLGRPAIARGGTGSKERITM